MANPFEKRATEYLRDDEAFLSVVSPEPLSTFFVRPAREDRLLDRLVMIIGTPGSGKTTMARLFQYSMIKTLLRNDSLEIYRPLIGSLSQCGVLQHGRPAIIGARLPLESEYREFWEFPYTDELKLGLLTALIQARAVLAWIYNLQSTGIPLEDIRIIPRKNSAAALASIGGPETGDILARAEQVELAIYQISAALVPPDVELISSHASTAYRPFDVIDEIEVFDGGKTLTLRPLIILDDAHTLQSTQFDLLRRWLARRELKVARWVITRFDALTPNQVLLESGSSGGRDMTFIRMQSDSGRARERTAFRKMAKDMSGRYLRRMDSFNGRGLTDLGAMLATHPQTLSASKLAQLAKHVDTVQNRTGVSEVRRRNFESAIAKYLSSRAEKLPDVSLSMLVIMMERYQKRTKSSERQFDIFGGTEEDQGVEPAKPIRADSGVMEGAEVHLLHKYDRPLYYGIDALCDASSENAEQFLQLASVLVDQLETKLIRGRSITLTSKEQDRLLRQRAAEIVKRWDFPNASGVRDLTEGIATECLAKSLEPNAPLKGGASAVGVPQVEFETIPEIYPHLAQVLQYSVAYNAIDLVQGYGTKRKLWCLLELGGALRLKYGLTLTRGGFIERDASHLNSILRGGQ